MSLGCAHINRMIMPFFGIRPWKHRPDIQLSVFQSYIATLIPQQFFTFTKLNNDDNQQFPGSSYVQKQRDGRPRRRSPADSYRTNPGSRKAAPKKKRL